MKRQQILEHHAGTVRGWNEVALRAIGAVQPGAPAAAHALAVLHTCMYNAWAAYDDTARQTIHGIAIRLPRAERSAASKACAMSHAAHRVLAERFPSQRTAFDAHLARLGLDGPALAPLGPAAIGQAQALAMRDACRKDGAGWLDAPSCAPSCGGAGLSPGRWCLLAHRVAERDAHDDDADVLLFFALATALADAAFAGTVGGAATGSNAAQARGTWAGAAAEVLRRFTGSDRLGDALGSSFTKAAELAAAGGMAGIAPGRRIGALAFDGARAYWQGKCGQGKFGQGSRGQASPRTGDAAALKPLAA